MSANAPRRRSREAALQVLYALDVPARDPAERLAEAPELVEEAFEAAAAHFELPPAARAFARELVHGVVAHQAKLDPLVARHATHWRLDRMAAVDRNVLRLGAYETCYTDTADAIVIDEAVSLARRFGGDASPGFVNGVLDALVREARKEAR
ncbi:MAG TPA: transcription antitermination factor NusB [Myxococcota bacterium]|jgi:N utilization substance protein B|nr:transcription antitermination factor NusB [Myxococcota bacterium]